MRPRVYLAGPEVFLADAVAIGACKGAVWADYGLIGVFPGDEPLPDPRLPRPEQGVAISRAMEALMRGCDAMIVNPTPFHGPSADVGSAYRWASCVPAADRSLPTATTRPRSRCV